MKACTKKKKNKIKSQYGFTDVKTEASYFFKSFTLNRKRGRKTANESTEST